MFGQLRDQLNAGKRAGSALPSGRKSSKFAKLAIQQVPPAHAEPAARSSAPSVDAAAAVAARHQPVPLPEPIVEPLELRGVLWREDYTPSGAILADVSLERPPFAMASELEISQSRWHPLFSARPRVGAHDQSAALELEREACCLLLAQVIAYGTLELVPMREQPCILMPELKPERLQLRQVLRDGGGSRSASDDDGADDPLHARLGDRPVPPVPRRAPSAAHIRASVDAECSDFDRAPLAAVDEWQPTLRLSPLAVLDGAASGCADDEQLASASGFEVEPFAQRPPALGMTCIASHASPLATPHAAAGFAFAPALNRDEAARAACLTTWAGVEPGAVARADRAEGDAADELETRTSSRADLPSVSLLGQHALSRLPADGVSRDDAASGAAIVVDASSPNASNDAGEMAPPWADVLVLASVYLIQPEAKLALGAPAAFDGRTTAEALRHVERWLDHDAGVESEAHRSVALPALPALALSSAYATRSSRQYILSPPTTRLAKSDLVFEACRLRLRGVEPAEPPAGAACFAAADGRFVERALLERVGLVGVSARAEFETFAQADAEPQEQRPPRAAEHVDSASPERAAAAAAAAGYASRDTRELPAREEAFAAPPVRATRPPDARRPDQEDAIEHFMRLRGLAPAATVGPAPAAPAAPAHAASSEARADAAAMADAPRAAGASLSANHLDALQPAGLQLCVGERAREHRSGLLISLASSRVELVHRDFWAPCMSLGVSAAGIFVDASDLMELNGPRDVLEELQMLAAQYSRCWLIVSGGADDSDAGSGLHAKLAQIVLAALSLPMCVIPLVPPTLASARDCVLRALALEQLDEDQPPASSPAPLAQAESADEQMLSAFLNPVAAMRVLGAPEWTPGRALVSFMQLSTAQRLERFPWLNRVGLDALDAMNSAAAAPDWLALDDEAAGREQAWLPVCAEAPGYAPHVALEANVAPWRPSRASEPAAAAAPLTPPAGDEASSWVVTRCYGSARAHAGTYSPCAAAPTAGAPATPAAATEGAGFFGYCAHAHGPRYH